MKKITTHLLDISGFVQNKNWWDYKSKTMFFVNLLSETIRLNTKDRALDFKLDCNMNIDELLPMADSWLKINGVKI